MISRASVRMYVCNIIRWMYSCTHVLVALMHCSSNLGCKWRHGILHPAVATDLGLCDLYLSVKFHFSLWRYACFVRMLGLGEFSLPNSGHLCVVAQRWQDIASQWCRKQVPLLLQSLQGSPAPNSLHLHLVFCWQMRWMVWLVLRMCAALFSNSTSASSDCQRVVCTSYRPM